MKPLLNLPKTGVIAGMLQLMPIRENRYIQNGIPRNRRRPRGVELTGIEDASSSDEAIEEVVAEAGE